MQLFIFTLCFQLQSGQQLFFCGLCRHLGASYLLFPKFLPQDPAFFSQISVVRNFPLTMPIRQSQFRCKILTFPI